MYSYRSKGMWSNSVVVHILISGLIWLPITTIFILGAADGINPSTFITVLLMLLALALYLLKRAQTKLRLPELEISARHLVLNRPLYKRAVYNLDEMTEPKIVFGFLYFRHLGWPVLTGFPHMTKEEQGELMAHLKAGQQAL